MTNFLWLRRDLQLADNVSLARALHEKKDVQPVFIFDTDILARFTNKQDRRISFIAHAVAMLHEELRKKGGGLLVLHGSPEKIIPELAKKSQVFAGEDYEPATIARDVAIGKKITLTLSKQHVLMSPREVLKDDGGVYKVFTPYAKQWHKKLQTSDHAEYEIADIGRYANFVNSVKMAKAAGFDVVETVEAKKIVEHIGYEYVEDKLWHPSKAHAVLKEFVAKKIANYPTNRDLPAIDGTSTISPYLRFGLVTVRQCYNAAVDKPSSAKWISELIWREFYMTILFHYPETVDTEFQPHYRKLKWNYDKVALEKWKQGKTGFPIVDAGMRQLLEDGWMHNRVRMIVASFLTKDLLIDWRAGEEHFAQHLMDYELASNVGGWQWGASTGTDAAPYFRIFNPITQGLKFDPQRKYINEYAPEKIEPMVDHAKMREKILAFFKEAR